MTVERHAGSMQRADLQNDIGSLGGWSGRAAMASWGCCQASSSHRSSSIDQALKQGLGGGPGLGGKIWHGYELSEDERPVLSGGDSREMQMKAVGCSR
jgi:hypothetical protein